MLPLPRASLETVSGHRVGVALSGGADSVALALWLHACTPLAGLIHVNHRLRGVESDRDEAFCRALAARLGLPIEVSVAPVAVPPGRSPEAVARAVRYRAFAAAALSLQATRVVTAHTADDQAETVLLRLLRGATNRGVSGIRAVRGLYARPFLACRRDDLRQWLVSQGEAWCEDSTNADRSLARNRIRHDLLPLLASIAPGGVLALARAARLADDDERVLEALAIEKASAVVLRNDAGATDLDRGAFQALEPALARRVLRRVCEQLVPLGAWRAEHFDAVRRLAGRGAGGGSVDLPGMRVERVSNVLRVRSGARAASAPFAYVLPVPGTLVVPEAGVEISASYTAGRGDGAWSDGASNELAGTYLVQVPAGMALPFTVRNRRPGDRVALSGGTRKVQDLMVDAKIPRWERDRAPLVVAADGQIAWVGAGYSRVGRASGWVRASDRDGVGDMVVFRIRKLEHK
ncbi:MAG: tRNA lysidine(34) synthetase TilS [Acidobacteria bacterium]|nr:tRNA lysidine(34) synthetase TilS [Acidobacteriota bacterium]